MGFFDYSDKANELFLLTMAILIPMFWRSLYEIVFKKAWAMFTDWACGGDPLTACYNPNDLNAAGEEAEDKGYASLGGGDGGDEEEGGGGGRGDTIRWGPTYYNRVIIQEADPARAGRPRPYPHAVNGNWMLFGFHPGPLPGDLHEDTRALAEGKPSWEAARQLLGWNNRMVLTPLLLARSLAGPLQQ